MGSGVELKPKRWLRMDINPLMYWITLVYLITRIVELLTGTENFWTNVWLKVVDTAGGDEYYMSVWYTNYFTMAWYWIVGAGFIIMDMTNRPKFFRKYKTQPEAHVPLDKARFFKASVRCVSNQLIGIPVSYALYILGQNTGMPSIRETTSFPRLLFDLFASGLIYEFAFYYSHRLLHHRSIYKYVHKVHHEWTAPVSTMAIYCHWIEHVLGNLIPITLGIAITGAPISTAWVWFCMTITTTLGDHSGYHLPFLHSPQFHDYHHLKFNECFGASGFLDSLHGTRTKFDESIHSVRHKTLFSLTASSELHPDSDTNNNEAKASKRD